MNVDDALLACSNHRMDGKEVCHNHSQPQRRGGEVKCLQMTAHGRHLVLLVVLLDSPTQRLECIVCH